MSELELQNEELRRSRLELECARDELTDLYENAPVGYVTTDERGLILGANRKLAAMLGLDSDAIVGAQALGAMCIDSHPDQGTSVRIVLPAYAGAARSHPGVRGIQAAEVKMANRLMAVGALVHVALVTALTGGCRGDSTTAAQEPDPSAARAAVVPVAARGERGSGAGTTETEQGGVRGEGQELAELAAGRRIFRALLTCSWM